jgi:predicted porin
MKKSSVNHKRLTSGFVLLMWIVSARAQSAVTLYGIVDSGLQYASKVATASGGDAVNSFSFNSAGLGLSAFGLRGREDLGGGFSTNFDLESGISTANGGFGSSNGNFWGRRAWVGINGGFGEIRFGLQASPFFLTMFDSDPRSFSSFASGLVIYGDNVEFTGGMNSNAITYLSPNVAGFNASVMFAPGGVAGNFQAGQQWSASANYDTGTLMVNAAMYHGNAGGASTPVPTTVQFDGRTLGVAYRFNGFRLKASIVNYNVAGSLNEYVYGAGADYVVTPSISVNAGAWFSIDRNHEPNHSLLAGVGATYLLSVRTSLYAQAGMVSNHGNMNIGLSVTDFAIMHEVRNATAFGANFGIRHTF